jgi:YidC/Oxa1 family membrane protein insertase
MFNIYLYQPILNTLVFITNSLGGNLGLGIIGLTVLLRGLLVPLTLPSLRSAQKIRELKPDLDKLKKRHGKDKKQLQKSQLELYKRNNINPAAGCLPNILQLVILIALYRVFITFLDGASLPFSSKFLWLDLTQPDSLYILPFAAGLVQLILSLMLSPGIEHHKEKTKKKTEDMQDMAETMGQQMLFLMPAMTVIIAFRFPSGLALYWVATTVFSVVQQYYVSGLGGLRRHLKKLNITV